MISNCRVVLIRPHYPGNLGATARVMHNFGLNQLVLVNPVARPDELEARRMATHSTFILDQARIVADLGEAIADCLVVLGTTGNVEGLYRHRVFGRPDEMLPTLLGALPAGPCAIVFGPEPYGLTNVEVIRCQGLIRIPTGPEYSSLNLAQAVAICLYELHRQSLILQGLEPSLHPLATVEEQERMYHHLREGLEAIGFLFGQKAEALMHGVRQLIARAHPSPNEVKILLGLARQLKWAAKQETGRLGDWETGRRVDEGTGRQGDGETESQ